MKNLVCRPSKIKKKNSISDLQKAVDTNLNCIDDFFCSIRTNEMHHYMMNMVLKEKIEKLEESNNDQTLKENNISFIDGSDENEHLGRCSVAYSIKVIFLCSIEQFKKENYVVLQERFSRNFIIDDAIDAAISSLKIINVSHEKIDAHWTIELILWLKSFFAPEVGHGVKANVMFGLLCLLIYMVFMIVYPRHLSK